MRQQAYDATVLYHPGKKMFLADTLSRAYIHGVNQEWVDDEDDVTEAEYIPVTERRLLELRSATKGDDKHAAVAASNCGRMARRQNTSSPRGETILYHAK